VRQHGIVHLLDVIALPDQAAGLGHHRAGYGDGWCIEQSGQCDGRLGCLVDIGQQPGLGHLAAHHRPGSLDERRLIHDSDAGMCGEHLKEREEPVAAAVLAEAFDLRKIQRQVMGWKPVQDLGLGTRDRFVGFV
jgi:hypothetical protein